MSTATMTSTSAPRVAGEGHPLLGWGGSGELGSGIPKTSPASSERGLAGVSRAKSATTVAATAKATMALWNLAIWPTIVMCAGPILWLG